MSERMPGIRQDPRNANRYQVRFLKTTFGFDSLDEAIEAQKRGKRRQKAYRAGDLIPPASLVNLAEWLITGGKKGIKEEIDPEKAPLSLLVDRYLEMRKTLVLEKKKSHKSYGNDCYQLEIFSLFCLQEGLTTIKECTQEEVLDQFKEFVKTYSKRDKPKGFEQAPASVGHAAGVVKRMIDWGWSKRLINELPRNLKEFVRVSLPKPKPQTYTADELQALYAKANPKFRLYILLAINCGYQQIDIATLERGMVDWDKGTITRGRHKTGVPQHSKLWAITLNALKEHSEEKGDLLLRSIDGNPLVWHKLRDDGGVWTSDCIQRTFNRLRKQCGLTKSFTDIRNTGASRIKNQYKPEVRGTKSNRELFDLYLAHSPHKMVASYDEGDWSELFTATDWLGTLYTFDTPQTVAE